MTTQSKSKPSRLVAKLARPLVSAGLIFGGLFQMVAPVLAAPTAAGSSIQNTATATYEDPNVPGTDIFSTSNTVTVTVAEIAGIIVEDGGVVDVNSGEVLPGDVINFDFIITNTGNDTTRITIPTPVITGPGTLGTATVIAVNGTAIAPVSIPAGGAETRNTATTDDTDLGDIIITGLTGSEALAPDQTITVRVPVTVNALAASGATIAVRLGDTGTNNNVEANTQNQESITDLALDNEVRTIDNDNGQTDEATGTPANREREASRFQDILVGATAQAFPTLLKTNAGIVDNGATPLTPTPTNLIDDYITYRTYLGSWQRR